MPSRCTRPTKPVPKTAVFNFFIKRNSFLTEMINLAQKLLDWDDADDRKDTLRDGDANFAKRREESPPCDGVCGAADARGRAVGGGSPVARRGGLELGKAVRHRFGVAIALARVGCDRGRAPALRIPAESVWF